MVKVPDLNFAGKNTLYATHALHPFAAKCPPPLARWGIENFSVLGETVLDPMMGSGTTLVEARLLGRHSIGADIDPLSRLIAQAKATPLCLTGLDRATNTLLAALDVDAAEWQLNQKRIGNDLNSVFKMDPRMLSKWFSPEVVTDLALLKHHIRILETSPEIRRFLWTAFSSLILAKTSVANARDIVHSRHHYWQHATTPDVLRIFRRRLATMRRMMDEFIEQCCLTVQTTVLDGDVRQISLEANSVHLVFTSPPYGTALDYPRAHFLSVAWLQDVLGVALEDYIVHGRKYIGTERAIRTSFNAAASPLPDVEQLHDVLRQLKLVAPQKALAFHKYFVDMEVALCEMGRVVQPGRRIVLVVCPSHIRKIQIPTNELLIQIASQVALPGGYTLRLEQQIERVLDDRRRLLPYMSEAFGERMRTEYTIILQKVPV